MTHYDPRDPRTPRPVDIDPATGDRHMPGSTNHPLHDPRLPSSAGGTGLMIAGGLAGALLLVFLVVSMFGGSADRTAQGPTPPPVQQQAPMATPTQPPAADPGTTGTIAPAQPQAPDQRN